MPENKPFVVNDRRKFTTDGELRPGATLDPTPKAAAQEESLQGQPVHPDHVRTSEAREGASDSGSSEMSSGAALSSTQTGRSESADFRNTDSQGASEQFADASSDPEASDDSLGPLPPPPTPEEITQVARAYESTVERLETAMRATNPGGERLPPMSFERLVQSLYMQALLQLGSVPEPGQPPQIDLLGARQTVEMLAILAAKTKGNLSDKEQKLLDSALFELRMGFLEVTQALARQAAARQPAPGVPGGSRSSGPSIVR